MINKIAIIGAGRMGSAMVRELVKENSDFCNRIKISDHNEWKLNNLSEYRIERSTVNIKTIENAKIIILAVRPQQMLELITEISAFIQPEQIVVSIAIGVPLKWLSERLSYNRNIFHIHPSSTMMAYSKGVSFICSLPNIEEKITEEVKLLFSNFGEVIGIEEKNIGAYAIFAGCSPAFFCDFLNKWKETAISMGIDNDIAKLVMEKMFEAIRFGMAQKNLQYSDIIDSIATPGGVTMEGLKNINSISELFNRVYKAGFGKIDSIKERYE
jgi:pyrroline-5-carboxylate reductase